MQQEAIDRSSRALRELVERTESRWRAQCYRPECLSRVAATSLRDSAAAEAFDLDLILELATSAATSAGYRRLHSSPSVLPLFCGLRFNVLAHVWCDDVGSPHQHGWAGAFQVVQGTTLHRTFAFEERGLYGQDLRIGRLTARPIELLQPGDVVAVEAGARTIHALSHIDRPSLSLSIRTVRPLDRTLEYARPGVVYDSTGDDPGRRLIERCLDLSAAADPEAYERRLLRLIRRCADTASAFYILRQWAASGLDEPGALRSLVRERQGSQAAVLLPAIDAAFQATT